MRSLSYPNSIDLTGILIVIFLLVFLFFLFREIVLWYWKVNKIVSLLEDIKKNTSKDESETPATLNPPRKKFFDFLKTEIKLK